MTREEIEYTRTWFAGFLDERDIEGNAEARAALNKVCNLALIGREYVATRAEKSDG